MRQHRAATAPGPSKPAIPPSLIPGHRHHTFSATGTNTLTTGLLCFGPSNGTKPTVPATAYTPGGNSQDYFSMKNPSPYRDFQPPPPPQPMPQSLLSQPVVPPLPPKTPVIMPTTTTTTTPTLPPKPPPFTPPPNFLLPPMLPRSRSQPALQVPRGAPVPPHLPPPPSVPPPPLPPPPSKPLGARSPSLGVKRSPNPSPQPLAQPNVSPIAKPSLSPIVKEPKDTPLPTSPPAKSPAEGSSGMNEEQELELVLKWSAETERARAEALLRAQDEDLARALEQSLIDSAPRPGPSVSRPRPSTLNNENMASSSSTIPRDPHPHSQKSQKPVSLNVTVSPVDLQLKEDEELARRLEAEDSPRPMPTPETNQRVDPKPPESPSLPRYGDIVGKETASVNRSELDATASPRVLQVQLNSARSRERLSNPDQANTPPRTSPSPAQRTSPRSDSQTTLTTTTSEEEAEAPEHSPTTSPQSPRPIVTANQFVGPELLYGASFGDHMPPVENVQFRGSLPNVLALPYGKGPPMHIRASSWRQLLKLLAKLSATRIEPTVEARAETKGALLLRTVIQFFKLHPSSTEWRTVIYLTIDYPPPPDHRFTNGVVNSLPYSYSLSTVPALLRDGPDSSLSKYYTIPATSGTPLPRLPISMPDMAMYLAAAVEDSRRARGDSSVSLRRLSKMINQFYPSQRARVAADDEEEAEPRRRGRALIGRLMGRPSKPSQGEGHNADMYDVVTPFVSEWG